MIAPTRALRDEINDTIQAQLIAEGAVSGPARQSEKLVSRSVSGTETATRIGGQSAAKSRNIRTRRSRRS